MNDMHKKEEKLKAFGEMLDVLDTLREKCPWDRKQTNESLRPNTVSLSTHSLRKMTPISARNLEMCFFMWLFMPR